MDWWDRTIRSLILLATVLCTICPLTESSFMNFAYRPGNNHIHAMGGCPLDTIFCMERQICVNLDGTCITPPTCQPDEVLQSGPYGLQQCVMFEHTCMHDEEACDIDGELTCVPMGECQSLDVTLKVEADYAYLTDDDYDDAALHFKTQIAVEIGLSPQQLLGFYISPDAMGMYIVFRAPLPAYDIFSLMKDSDQQFLTDMTSNELNIDWSQSWIGDDWPDVIPAHYDDVQDCKQEQLYCFQGKSCVNVDSSCPAEPTCQSHQMLCSTDGRLGCVDYGSCSYVEGYLYLRDADFDTLLGTDLSDVPQFTDHFKTVLANTLQTTKSYIWNVHYERGSVGIYFSVTPELYDKLMELKNNGDQFMTDMNGNQLDIDWHKAHTYEYTAWNDDYHEECRDGYCITCMSDETIDWNKKECVRFDDPREDYYDGYMHQCGQGELYCFQKKGCVNVDGSCPAEPTCHLHQMVCNTDGKLDCVDYGSCSYVEGYIYLKDADFDTLLGPDLSLIPQFTDHFKTDLAAKMQTPKSNVWNVHYEKGSLGIHFSVIPELYDKLMELVNLKEQFVTDLNGNQLDIDWDQAYAYEHTSWNDDYYEDCRDGYCITCMYDQTIDWTNKECVPDDDTWNDSHGDWGIYECGQGELYCFQSKRCVTVDGFCVAEPSCQSHQTLCSTDGKLGCVDYGSCSYTEVSTNDFTCIHFASPVALIQGYIYLSDADFDSLLGTDLSNAPEFTDHFKTLLVDKLLTSGSNIWNVRYERGSIGIRFFATPELYDKLMGLKNNDAQFVTDLNGNQMPIDWQQSYAIVHTAWTDGYYDECRDDICISCMLHEKIDWTTADCVPYDDNWEDSHDDWGMYECGQGELYCFQSKRCVTFAGFCVAEPSCQSHQMLCSTDGKLGCVDYGSCSYTEGYIYLSDADFDSLLGTDLSNAPEFTDHFKTLLVDKLLTSGSNIWNVLYERGSIGIRFFATPELYDKLMGLKNNDAQFVTDLNGNQLHIDWQQSYAIVHTAWNDGYYDECRDDICMSCLLHEKIDWTTAECVPYDDHWQDSHNDDEMHECDHGELYCFETRGCATASGECPLPECNGQTTVCYINSEFQCAGYCQYASFSIVLDANFFDLVGRHYERYDSVKATLIEQMAGALGVGEDMFIDAHVFNGSVIIWGRLPHQLYDDLQYLLMVDRSLSLSYDMDTLRIMHEKTIVYEETFDGGWVDHNDNDYGEDPDHCPDCYNDADHYCPDNELFCFEKRSCVTMGGQCPIPECIGTTAVCYIDSKYECSDYCEYSAFKLEMDANFFDHVGRHYERYDHVKAVIINQIAGALGVGEHMFIDAYMWNGSLIFWARLPHEFFDSLQNLLMEEQSFSLSLDGVPLHIMKAEVYEEIFDGEKGWMDYNDYRDGGGPDSCPECHHEPEPQCHDHGLYCFEARSCVTADGHCLLQECTGPTAMCYIDSKFECSEFCEYASFKIEMDADFFHYVGIHYERYDHVEAVLIEQLADALGVGEDMFIDVYMWNGSLIFWGRLPHKLYDSLHNLLMVEQSLSLSLDGDVLDIMKAEVYEEIFDGEKGWIDYSDDTNGGGPDQCSDCHHEPEPQCGEHELFCFEALQCINRQNGCIDETLCPNPDEEPCLDGNGKYVCMEPWNCNNDGSYKTMSAELILDADFELYVYHDNGATVIHDLRMGISMIAYIDPANIMDISLKPGSIVANITFIGSYDELEGIIYAVQEHVKYGGMITIDGTDVQILSFVPGKLIDSGYPGEESCHGDDCHDDDCYGDNCFNDNIHSCSSDELFCFETLQCTTKGGECSTTDECLNPEEERCYDGNGNYECMHPELCNDVTTTITVTAELVIDADYAQYVDNDNGVSVIHDLKMGIATIANIDPAKIIDISLSPGSIIADITFSGLPEELEAIFDAIQNHIDIDGYITVGGTAVEILSFIHDKTSEHDGPGGDHGCYGDKCFDDDMQQCENDQLFCFETFQCITGECTDTPSGDCSKEEEMCSDGNGNYVCMRPDLCYSDDNVVTANAELILDADYGQYVDHDNGVSVVNDLKMELASIGNIDPVHIHDIFLRPGSIFAEITFVGDPVMLNATLNAIQVHTNNVGSITLQGNSVQIISFTIHKDDTDKDDDFSQHPDDDDYDDTQTCPDGQILCLETSECVAKDIDNGICEPNTGYCSDTEDYCFGAEGHLTCVDMGTCAIKSVKLTMLTDANYDQIVQSETAVVDDLKPQIATILTLQEDAINDIVLFKGSLGIEVSFHPSDPVEMDAIFNAFKQNVMQAKVYVNILGTEYLVRSDSPTLSVEFESDEPECEVGGSCEECLDHETQCHDRDDSESITCVPRDICRLAPDCPFFEKDAVSTCVTECDSKVDTENADGEYCCSNACGGGVYMAVPEIYICPWNKTTGICLTPEDINCASGEEWCTFSFTCETPEECDKLSEQTGVDAPVVPDRFIVRLQLLTEWQDSLTIVKTTETETSFFQEALVEFEISVKDALEQTLADVDNPIITENAAVYPEQTDLHILSVYVEVVSANPGTVSVDDIKDTVDTVTFTSQYFTQISRVNEVDTSVVLLSGDVDNLVYFMTEPVFADTVATFDLLSVVPADLFTSIPVQATIDCSGQAVDILIDATPNIAAVSSDGSVTIRHTNTEITVVKCELTSSQFKDILADMHVFIGIIVLPKPIEELDAVTELLLDEAVFVETEEDSIDCISGLPGNLITVITEGDTLLDIFHDWPAQMTHVGEIWYSEGLTPLTRNIKHLVQSYLMSRSTVISNLRSTVSVDQPSAAKLSYRGSTLRGTDVIDILASKENMQLIKICIAADYSGLINIAISLVLSDTTTEISAQISINVIAVNDAPTFISRDLSQAVEEFVHPALLSDRTDDQSMSTFIVGELMSVLFTDDSPDRLGMALIGSILPQVTTAVEGQWQYSRDGSTWTDISQIDVPDTDNPIIDVTLLNPTTEIRFVTHNTHSWKMNEAPRISFLAWDRSNNDPENPDLLYDEVTMTKCHSLQKGMRQYCRQEGSDAYSNQAVVLTLARRGCDGAVDSQKEILTCGCADDTSCNDCNNVPHGTDEYDACAVCGGTYTNINCSVSTCKENNLEFCSRYEELQEIVNNICEEGQELISPEYSPYCKRRCIEPEEDVHEVCNLPCDVFECLDCAGEIGKNEINFCGVCQTIETLNAGCETIGNIVPKLSNPQGNFNITVDVATSLVQSDIPVINCNLATKDPTESGVQIPVVTATIYIPGTSTTPPSIALTLHISTDATSLPALGEFAVTCTIGDATVSTADASEYLLLYEQPNLISVAPEHSMIKDVSYVIVTSEGIFVSETLNCVSMCFDSDDECDAKLATGERISDIEASCPMSKLISRGIGRKYKLFVDIGEPSNIDTTRLAHSNAVTFSVLMPAPTIVSAYLNKDECGTVTVEFDSKVTSTESEGCSNFIVSPTFESDVKCILLQGNRKLFIENVNSDIEDQGLEFIDGVIWNAADINTDIAIVNFLSGTVTVQGEDEPIVQIDPRLPEKIGCNAVTLRPIIRNKGCWDITMSWVVTADGADAALLGDLQNEIGQRKIFKISGGQLEESVEYTFTLSWQAGKYSGEDVVTLMKDSASTSSVDVYGVEDEHDVAETINPKAKIRPCDPNDADITISWTLTPAVAQLEYTDRTFTRIQGGSLQYQSSYELRYTVIFGNGEIVSGSVPFTTKGRTLQAGIRYIDDRSSQPRELKEDDDLTLSCVNLDDTTDQSEYTCTWTCKSNFLAYDKNEMLPCFEFKDSQYVQLERTGQSITLSGADRLRPPRNFNLREEWTVVMAKNGHTSVSKGKSFEFKQVPVELMAPEIRRKTTDTYIVTDSITTITIDAGVRKATQCKWEVSEEDDTDVFPFDVFSGGVKDKTMQYSEKYRDCSIDLDLSNPGGDTLKPGQLYAVKLTAYNKLDDVYLSKSYRFSVRYIQAPQQNALSVIPDTEIQTAWETSFIASFLNTDTNDDLRCDVYYTNTLETGDIRPKRLNTLPVSQSETLSFTLPEGEIKVEASCCNIYDLCASAEEAGTFTVQPTDSTGILNVIERDLSLLTTIESDMILRMVNEIKNVVETVISDASEAEKATNILKEALQQSIFTSFAKSSNKRSKIAVFEQAAEFVSPGDLDDEAKTKLQQEASDFVKEATGQSTSKRKRRSSEQSSSASGLTVDDASTVIGAFESTISEDMVTEEDATFFKEMIDDVMVGLCRAFTGSTPWLVPNQLSYVRVQSMSLNGYATTETDVSCSACAEVEYPVKVTYGSELETVFNDTWDCVVYAECSDVCVATAQIGVDIFSPIAVEELEEQTRRSDVIILKMINPESYAVETINNLQSPIEAILTLSGTVDLQNHEYRCLMWVSGEWSDETCNTSITLDEVLSEYKALCSCNALGTISVFQRNKTEETLTSAETTVSTSTSTTSSAPSVTNNIATTTAAQSKNIKSTTDYALCEFRLTDNFDASVGSSETDLKNKIKQDISAQTGYSTNSFRNLQIAPGSIIVTFELHTAESGETLGQMVYKLEDMLNSGALTFSTTGGTPLNLQANSFTYEEVDEDDGKQKSDSDNLPFIIGGVLGGLIIVCVTVIIVLLIVKNKKQKTHPVRNGHDDNQPAPRYNTPPPTYALAPPPPYMYVDPPEVNKWVENELQNDKKKPLDEKRPSSNSSDAGGSSYERRMQNKVQNMGPTPVAE